MRTKKRPATKVNDTMMRQPDIGDTMVHVRADVVPTAAQIRALAYEIYCIRCDRGEHGDELADWIAAESKLLHTGEEGARATRSSAHAEPNDASPVRRMHAEAVS